jgi:hypothetical protein
MIAALQKLRRIQAAVGGGGGGMRTSRSSIKRRAEMIRSLQMRESADAAISQVLDPELERADKPEI